MAPFDIRPATPADISAITALIARSVRGLCDADYSSVQLETALGNVFGVDSQLIADGTYFVVEGSLAESSVVEGARELLAAGGWSYRKTLFGADARPDRSPEALDPAHDAAKIRAFFVAPEHARRGIGRALLARCEAAARAHGFRSAEMAATLTGERLYSTLGYLPIRRFTHVLEPGVTIDFIAMQKSLAP